MTENSPNTADDPLFITLISDLVTQGWVALGKIKHPLSDKVERNIPAARIVIELLDMLNRKTAGNRSEAEDHLLMDAIKQLKLNYVTEANRPESTTEPEEAAAEEQAPAPSEETGTEKQEPATAEETEKKESSTKGKVSSSGAKKRPSPSTGKKKKTGGTSKST